MKTIFRFFSFGALMTAFIAVGTTAGYAQDPCADADGQTAVYTKFTGIYNKKTVAEMETALTTGKEFLEKYGACEILKEQIDFVRPQVARIEKELPGVKIGTELAPFFTRFDAGILKDNADEIYAAGKEILARQPENINVIVPLGVVGLYQSYNKNNKYADDTIKYARMALAELKAGKPCNKKNASGAEVCGVLKYEFLRADAINELTYATAYLNYYAKNDKKSAIPIYYEISQSSGKYKDDPRVYATIGSFYVDEAVPLGKEIADLIALQKDPAGTDEEKLAREAVIKGKVALFNGYTERSLDAFGRAHKVAKSDTPANKTFKDGLYKQLQDLYQRRFEKKDGLDTYIASVVAKPMPNPTSPVTPVADPEPATTTTTTTTTTTAPAVVKPPATTPPTKPASATITKVSANGSDTAAKPVETTTAVRAKTAVKKPVVKKKGKG